MKNIFFPIHQKHIPKGVKFCIDNANRLLKDAEFLHYNQKYPSSIIASILAFEEIAKARMLRSKWFKGKPVTKEDWKQLTKHSRKAFYGFRFLNDSLSFKINSKRLKELQSRMVKRRALQSTEDKEIFSYVNWSSQGWISPMYPFPMQIYSNNEQQVFIKSSEKLDEVRKSIGVFMKEKQTQKILQTTITESINPQKFDSFIAETFPKFDLSVKGASITLGEFTKLTIKSKKTLDNSQKTLIEKTIRKKLPFLEELNFITPES